MGMITQEDLSSLSQTILKSIDSLLYADLTREEQWYSSLVQDSKQMRISRSNGVSFQLIFFLNKLFKISLILKVSQKIFNFCNQVRCYYPLSRSHYLAEQSIILWWCELQSFLTGSRLMEDQSMWVLVQTKNLITISQLKSTSILTQPHSLNSITISNQSSRTFILMEVLLKEVLR